MSSPGTPPNESEAKPVSDENALKAEKLLNAKKRLEELKKKQKKKNKKKDTKKDEKEEKSKSDDKKEPEATEPEEPKDIKPEAAKLEESKDIKPETKDEPEEDLKESVESLPKDDTSLAADADKESEVTSENVKEEKDTPTVASPIPVSTPSKLEARIKELETKLLEANLKISDMESDANTSLLQSKPDTEKPTDTDNSLTPASSNDHKLKTQIENLKVENAYLNDKVYSLEARIANMIAANKKRSLDFPNRDGFAGGSDVDSDIGSLSSPIIDAADGAPRSGAASQHHPRLSSFAEMDLYGDVNKIKDINKDMQRWSNWTIDIRNWRSLGIGPIFEA